MDYRLELCEQAGIGSRRECGSLLRESGELLAIRTASIKTAKAHRHSIIPKPKSAIGNSP